MKSKQAPLLIFMFFWFLLGFPGGSAGKDCVQCGRLEFNPWVGKIPWRKEWLPTPVFWPGEFQGLYSPWGHKELDTTEQLSLSFGLNFHLNSGMKLAIHRKYSEKNGIQSYSRRLMNFTYTHMHTTLQAVL